MSFVFKAWRRAHSWNYVTVAATPKTEDRASKIGKSFLDDSLVPYAGSLGQNVEDSNWLGFRNNTVDRIYRINRVRLIQE